MIVEIGDCLEDAGLGRASDRDLVVQDRETVAVETLARLATSFRLIPAKPS
jgi:hypothetical protein